MTPAEAYQESCKLLDIVSSELVKNKDDLTVDVIVNIGWMLQMAQVHATLATVDPVRLANTKDVAFYSQQGRCACPQLAGAPFARTSTNADCPIHGDPG